MVENAFVRNEVKVVGVFLAVILAIAFISVVSFKWLVRKSYLKGHPKQRLEEVYSAVKDQISRQVFNEVWSKVGEAYSIDSDRISPSDTFHSFAKMDSWALGRGEQIIAEWLARITRGASPPIETVLDLARCIQGFTTKGQPRHP